MLLSPLESPKSPAHSQPRPALPTPPTSNAPQPPAKSMPTKQIHGLTGTPNSASCSATGTCPAPLHHGSASGGDGPSHPLAGPPAGWGAKPHGHVSTGRRAEDWLLKQGGAEPARRPVCDARGKGNCMSTESRGKERAGKRRVPEDFPGVMRTSLPEPRAQSPVSPTQENHRPEPRAQGPQLRKTTTQSPEPS